jgi:ATP-binding cassette, subfamily B, multidrug efflux pump
MRLVRHLGPYLLRYRGGIAAGLACVALANLFGIAVPYLVGRGIDALARPGADQQTVLAHALLVVAAALVAGAARFGMRQLLNGISRRVETDLRDDLFEHLLRLDAGFWARHRTGDIMSRATSDTVAVRMAAGPGVMYLFNTVVLTALVLAFMLRTSVLLTAVALVPLLLLPPLVLGFGRVIHRRFEQIQAHLGVLTTMVQENLAGARVVRAYTQEAAQREEFQELSREYRRRNLQLARTYGLFHPLFTLLTGLGMVAVIWFGGRELMAGRITTGEFVAFGIFLGMLAWPMISLGWVVNLFERGEASMKRIEEILATVPAIADPPAAATRQPPVRGELEFRDVWFRYPGTIRDVLRGVSFRIPAGRTVALVGPTGAGKSTIIGLLARLHDATAGEILLDGEPLRALPLARVREALGIVPQDAFVFSETIEDNISFGLAHGAVEAAGEELRARVRTAAATARLDEAIQGFPAGYDTRLGERGVNLSGGQRQRATLARALARDPAVLVLDDALSAVDTQTETEILLGLRSVLRSRTALVVSHRVTAVMKADRILVLDDGRIVERGTHGELVRTGGVYPALLRRQLLEEGLASDGGAAPLAAAARDV